MKKKILLTITLICISIFALGSISVLAASSGTCGDNLKWNISGNTLTISGTGDMTSLTSNSNYPWFSSRTSIKTIVIGEDVTSIGEYAFYNHSSLTSIRIGSNVTTIGDYAFGGCDSLTSVNITNIASWCNIDFSNFSSNPLYYAKKLYLNGELIANLFIPDSVTSIGDYAFEGCDSITSVTIGKNVTSIGKYAFNGCTGLANVTIGDSVTSIL